ncbi:DUF2334 domain-containing protein [Roseisolibacter agri]|uniref:DUF2334 domain-containing protein n=1 Tax=Roseisolibacter agri TaxID=2014610 RepID=A0AA37Q1R8_9BACT|nr:DUF2334 domain-containing protein [Roseisolibacter agri]GLC24964.1 hypothetical protein rosag_14770 [Roseisolibacter agri]
MRPFLVCIHDATPAYAHETRAMLRDLAPLLGRRLSFGVVPDWDGAWPLAAHADYCALLRESADELLLHGYRHRRARGWGAATLLAERSDEMGGLDAEETRCAVERGQRAFVDAFGAPARGFLAPAWQRGHVCAGAAHAPGIAHVLGFLAVESADARVPLATWTWDCGRWGWLGHVGHGIGMLGQALGRGVPSLAIHPRDLRRGFWPRILRLVRALVDEGREPTTPAALLGTHATRARAC